MIRRTSTSSRAAAAIFLTAAVGMILLSGIALAGDIAIVVHPSVPVSDLSLEEVRSLLLANRQFWSPDLRVSILIRAPLSREREMMIKHICGMTEAQFRQYWISKIFRDETTAGPRIVYSNEMASVLVSQIPGSIALVDAAQVQKGLKVLKVDGHLPGEAGYKLH